MIKKEIIMSERANYITSDLYLTAFLKSKGHNYTVEKVRSKYNFTFEVTDEFFDDVNDYLSGNGSCEPLAFTNCIKNLKNYLYNNR
jgi:hypothetical protein